jgi:hypothetical protein
MYATVAMSPALDVLFVLVSFLELLLGSPLPTTAVE